MFLVLLLILMFYRCSRETGEALPSGTRVRPLVKEVGRLIARLQGLDDG